MKSNFAYKVGAMTLMALIALFPWEKQVEKHERRSHPERYEDDRRSKGKGRAREGDRKRGSSSGGRRR